MNLRENWRVLVLVVLLVGSGVALFVPTGSAGDAGNATSVTDGPTNLDYGLELSGGTRIRAQLVGLTAENVDVNGSNTRSIESQIASELGVTVTDVRVRAGQNTVELFNGSFSEQEFATALQAAGLDVSTGQIRPGVTDRTFQTAEEVINERITRGELPSGGTASVVQSATGQDFLVVEVPGEDRATVKRVLNQTGRVQIVAGYPAQTGNGSAYNTTVALTKDDIRRIGPAREGEGNDPAYVRVTLTDEAAPRFVEVMNENGFTEEGVGRCRWPADKENPGWCLYTVVDGNRTYGASLSPDLAESIRQREPFLNSPVFLMQDNSYEGARELKVNLEAGALPTNLDIKSEMYLAPTFAQKFKPLALVTGLVAWLVVSGVIFYRYREIRVAVPMLLTAAAEVFILLGFAAVVDLSLNLSHIAGFIAVIGTGVDDLVIIADEILQRGEITTGRVFSNRFRKAFWVIGAAAATTIIAMSPLAVLSLGELQGFAIVTIVGVLIGVLVTRPAYGDILRSLLLDMEE